MPSQQGSHDGLCGIYAIANAYAICGYDKPEHEDEELQEIFQITCGALANRRWPDVLREGTTFGDMMKMIARRQRETVWWQDIYGFSVKVSYPFFKKTPRTNKEYWERFDDILKNDGVACFIAGMETPWAHWVVVEPALRGKLLFSDSEDGEIHRVDIDSVHAGPKKPSGKDVKINRQELIVFSVTEVE